jgi:hypothetical protein
MLDTTTTMVLFLGALVVSQLIGRKALSTLTPEQKLALMESSPRIPWTLIFIAVAYGIQSWLSERFGHSATFLGGFMLVLICGLLLSYFLMFRRFQRLGLPPSYLQTLVIGQSIVLLALLVMFWSSYSRIRDIDATTQKLLNGATRTNPDVFMSLERV